YAIAALEHVENFKVTVMCKRSDCLHHALGSIEAGPYHPGTGILQSEIFGKEPRHIDRLPRIEQPDKLAKRIRLNRHQLLPTCAVLTTRRYAGSCPGATRPGVIGPGPSPEF